MNNKPIALAAAAAIATTLLSGCGSDKTKPIVQTHTQTPTSGSAQSGPTVAPLGRKPAPAKVRPTSAMTYAKAFEAAWAVGNRDTALDLGTARAVSSAFSSRDRSIRFGACDGAAGFTECQWASVSGHRLTLRVDNKLASEGAAHAVVDARWTGGNSYFPIPTTPPEYATAFVDLWVAGNRTLASYLATQTVLDTVFAVHDATGPKLTGCEGAAGSSYCTFEGDEYTLTLRLSNEMVSLGQKQAIFEASFGH